MAKALKRHGFRFVGPTTCYAADAGDGMVNDHLRGCHRSAPMRGRFLGQVVAAYLLCRVFSFVVLAVVAGHQAPVTWTGPHPDYLS